MKPILLAAAFCASLLAETSTGPAVGARVPEFEAKDQNGQSHTLTSLLGPHGAILVFYRSADWCPFCKAQLVELQQSFAAVKAQGLGLAAVSYDSPETLKAFADRKEITFPLLSDPGSKIIRAYGILNDTVTETNTKAYGIPFPGIYVLDAKGVVVAKYFEDDYKERDTVSSIMVRQFGLSAPGPHTAQQSKQLALSSSASTAAAVTGEHVTLVLDIDLRPRMHVYAPGVEHYIAIDWQMEPAEAIRSQPVLWPKPEVLRLEAINETVPVYRDHLRAVRDIVFAPDARLKALAGVKGEITVKGILRYQACDDRMCYIPASVPLEWTFTYQPPDSQRATK